MVMGRLPSLGTALVVLVMAVLLVRGDWRGAVQLGMAALLVFSTLAAPRYLGFLAMVTFLGAGMPRVSETIPLGQYRWAVLLVLALGLIFRNSTGVSGSRWHPTQFSLGLFICFALFSSSYSVNGLMTLLKTGTFACLLLGSLLYGRMESQGGPQSPCTVLDQLYWCALAVGLGCLLVVARAAGQGYFRGPFGNANHLGAFIPFIAPVLLLRLYQSAQKQPLVRALNVALTAMFGVFLLMSRSRTGIIATCVGCAWWLYFSSRKAFTWFVATLLLSAVILFAYFPRYVGSLNEVYVQKNASYILQSRQRLIEESWEAAKENAMLGIGFGTSKGSEQWEFGFTSSYMGREKMNSFLALVEEVGLVGTVLLVYPLAWVLSASARRLKRLQMFRTSEREYWTIVTLSACLLGGLVDSMGEAWLTAAGFFCCVMFWLLFGVLSTRLTARMPARQ